MKPSLNQKAICNIILTMGYPKVVFETRSEALANYLCYLGKQIACGFYQDRRFLVLPKLVEKETRVVYFPDLPYPKEFWGQVSKFKQDQEVFFFEKETVEVAVKLLSLQEELLLHKSSSLEMLWRKKEKEFFDTCKEFLPKFPLNQIRTINVLVSPFGTVGSFHFKRTGKFYDFTITVRSDFGPAQIAESILSLMFWIENTVPKLTLWYQTEANVDFLLTKTKLGAIFDFSYIPTVSALPDLPAGRQEIPANLVAESENYLKKLGFPIKPILDIPLNKFTPNEKRILGGFIANKNKILTYDQIGEIFWGNDEAALDKFNLYSIAKIMEKIRKKIKDHGIYQELIYTVRGQGYVLYD